LNVDTPPLARNTRPAASRINVIPREGGNTLTGALFASYAKPSWQASNINVRAAGTRPARRRSAEEQRRLQSRFGGPLKKDTLWFLPLGALQELRQLRGRDGYDKNFNNPSVWTFEPDHEPPRVQSVVWKGGQLRLSWQASSRNKIGINLAGRRDRLFAVGRELDERARGGADTYLSAAAADADRLGLAGQQTVCSSKRGVNRYRAASNLGT